MRRRWTVLGIAAAIGSVGTVTAIALRSDDENVDRRPTRCTIGSDLIVTDVVHPDDHATLRVLRAGHAPQDLMPRWSARDPSISPDGRRVAVAREFDISNEGAGPAAEEVWTVGLDGSRPVRLTHGNRATQPSWSPDGRRIVFVGVDDRSPGYLATLAADGSGTPHRLRAVLTTGAEGATSPRWSPDGSRIAFGNGRRIVIIDADDGHEQSTMPTDGLVSSLVWDPDGRSLTIVLFDTVSTGPLWTIHRINVETGQTRPIRTGFRARWSTDGKRLYVLDIAHERPRILVSTASPASQQPGSAREVEPPITFGPREIGGGPEGLDVGRCS